MNKFIKKNIATSLILGQLISGNMCAAEIHTQKSWQEKSVEKLQSFAREIKSSIKADTGWWIGGTGVAVGTILFGGYLLFNNRMSLKFVEQYEKLKNDISSEQINVVKTTISSSDFSNVLSAATECLKKDDMVININTNGDKLLIASDIHGDFNSLSLVIDEFLKDPDNTKLLFLGDYVDRGNYSVEVLYTLALLKICYPNRVFLLRGNHESTDGTWEGGKVALWNTHKNGQNELNNKKLADYHSTCVDFFGHLPIAAVVDNTFFCAHGGVNKGVLADVKVLKDIQRPYVICAYGDSYWGSQNDLAMQIVWSYPKDEMDMLSGSYWYGDSGQGSYNLDYVRQFLTNNNLKCLIHGHNHENTHTFNDPREICVCTNPLNWYNPTNNKPVGLIEIQNNTLKLLTYDYTHLSGSPTPAISHDYN